MSRFCRCILSCTTRCFLGCSNLRVPKCYVSGEKRPSKVKIGPKNVPRNASKKGQNFAQRGKTKGRIWSKWPPKRTPIHPRRPKCQVAQKVPSKVKKRPSLKWSRGAKNRQKWFNMAKIGQKWPRTFERKCRKWRKWPKTDPQAPEASKKAKDRAQN